MLLCACACVCVRLSLSAWALFFFLSLSCLPSSDVTGRVRIWDTTQEEHALKYEYRPLAGRILGALHSAATK